MTLTYYIDEIFTSYQGEGSFLGLYATFIRFAGCNLRCGFCDEIEALGISEGTLKLGLNRKIQRQQNSILVSLMSAPTLYNLSFLVDKLKKIKKRIHLETNGTLYKSWLKNVDWICASPKGPYYCPDKHTIQLVNEWKFVVDSDFSLDCIRNEILHSKKPIYLQPVNNDALYIKKALDMLKECPGLRLSLQTHKLLSGILGTEVQ